VDDFAAAPVLARLAQRWGHSAHVVLSAAIVAVIVIGLYPPQGPLMLTAPVALAAVVLTSWVLMRHHDRGLCEQCLAAMPLNPADRAARCRRMFWVTHCGTRPRYLVPYLVVLIGSNFASASTGTFGHMAWALIQASMIYLIASYTMHRRLQPWCPWCRDDGGGGEDRGDVAPPPPPVDRHQPV
jgi:hypothetical protein